MLGGRPLSLIELTVANLVQNNARMVGLLASPMTIQTRLYEDQLEARGIRPKVLNAPSQKQIEQMIRATIAGKKPSFQELSGHIQSLRDVNKIQEVILGCTELSVIAGEQKREGITDPLGLVVEAIFEEAA